MRSVIFKICGLLMLLALMPQANAQPGIENGRQGVDSIDALIPEGTKPDLVRVINEAGESVDLTRANFEELERAKRVQAEVAAANTVVLERMTLEVKPEGGIARIQGTAKAVLGQPTTAGLEIPLNLSSIQILPPDDDSSFPIGVASDGTGFLWRISKGEELERQLRFNALSNVQRTGQSQFLRLVLPMTTCTLVLTLPQGDWDVNTTGSESEVVEPITGAKDSSQFRIRSSGGPIDITWGLRTNAETGQATEALCETEFQLSESGNEFTALSTVTLSGPKRLGGRKFSIHLPPNAIWNPNWTEGEGFVGYKLSQASPVEGSTPAVQVEVDETFSGFEVKPELAWTVKPVAQEHQVELGNLMVSGVDRQITQVDLQLPRARTLLWRPQSGITYLRRTDAKENDDSLIHTFRVIDQTVALKCSILLPVSSPNIKGEYRVWLFPDRWLLSGSLDMHDAPRTLPFLQLESQGWKIEKVTAGSSGRELNFIEGISETGENATIPLNTSELVDSNPNSNAAPSLPSADSSLSRRINIRMSKPISIPQELGNKGAATDMSFELPILTWLDEASQEKRIWTPQASIQLFSSTANLDPIAVQDESSGWSLETNPISVTEQSLHEARVFNPREGKPRFTLGVNVRGVGAPYTCRFSASLLDATYETTTNLRATAQPDSWKIEQDWLLQIKGIYPMRLKLAVPKNWLDSNAPEQINNSIDVNINGIAVTGITPIPEAETVGMNQRFKPYADHSIWLNLEVPTAVYATTSIDSPWLVTVNPIKPILRNPDRADRLDQLIAHLESDSERYPINYSSSSSLILYRPEDRLLLNGKSVSKSQSVIQIGDERWNQTRIQLSMESPRVDVTLVPLSQSVAKPVHVERQWVQTAINGNSTRHRSVVRFQTNLPSITVEPPRGILGDNEDAISAILNGERISLERLGEENVTFQIDLTNARRIEPRVIDNSNSVSSNFSSETYVLELFTWPSQPYSIFRQVNLPRFQIAMSDMEQAPLFWQVVCGTSQHLISTSEALSPDYRWKWSHFFFARQDQWSQSELEQDIGASVQPDVGNELNQYTLMALDSKSESYVTLAPRYAIWTPVALLTLLLTAFAIRTNLIFSPIMWCIGVPTALAIASWSLDLSVLVVQSLLVALSVIALYSCTRWVLDRDARKRSVFAGRGNSAALFPSLRNEQRGEHRSDPPSGNASLSLATTIAPQPTPAPKSLGAE